MTNSGDALRATSDSLVGDLDTLHALEQEKRNIDPGDPQLVRVAAQIEELARRVLGESITQLHLTERVNELAQGGSPHAPQVPIAEIKRDMRAILADWRDAERRAGLAAPGSAEARAAETDIERLRLEYREAFEDARRRD